MCVQGTGCGTPSASWTCRASARLCSSSCCSTSSFSSSTARSPESGLGTVLRSVSIFPIRFVSWRSLFSSWLRASSCCDIRLSCIRHCDGSALESATCVPSEAPDTLANCGLETQRSRLSWGGVLHCRDSACARRPEAGEECWSRCGLPQRHLHAGSAWSRHRIQFEPRVTPAERHCAASGYPNGCAEDDVTEKVPVLGYARGCHVRCASWTHSQGSSTSCALPLRSVPVMWTDRGLTTWRFKGFPSMP